MSTFMPTKNSKDGIFPDFIYIIRQFTCKSQSVFSGKVNTANTYFSFTFFVIFDKTIFDRK